jgi:hypothetical protein
MNVNLYLPDDLGKEAKQAGLPLSRLLQGAVIEELERRRMIDTTLSEPQEFELDLEDSEGRPYTGRISGVLIATGRDERELYLTEDERVIGYEPHKLEYHVLGSELSLSLAEQVGDFLEDNDACIEALHALGETPIVDL